MAAARGDTKPCTAPDCPGTMQYGRRTDRDGRSAPVRPDSITVEEDVKGWLCSAVPEHFREQ